MTKISNSFLNFERAISETKPQIYVLRLYVTGATSKSIQAIRNISKICEEYLPGQCHLEIIDIYRQPARVYEEQVVVAPTLVKKFPPPSRKFIGTLSNVERVLQKLGLTA